MGEDICRTCGAKGFRVCMNCWEVEKRIDLYLRSERGRAFIAERLAEAASEKPE